MDGAMVLQGFPPLPQIPKGRVRVSPIKTRCGVLTVLQNANGPPDGFIWKGANPPSRLQRRTAQKPFFHGRFRAFRATRIQGNWTDRRGCAAECSARRADGSCGEIELIPPAAFIRLCKRGVALIRDSIAVDRGA